MATRLDVVGIGNAMVDAIVPSNKKEVLNNNFSFWLNCDTQILLNRIKKSKKRPIAFNLSDSKLTELILKRTKIYSKAQFKINCHKLKKTEIVKKILKIHEHN